MAKSSTSEADEQQESASSDALAPLLERLDAQEKRIAALEHRLKHVPDTRALTEQVLAHVHQRLGMSGQPARGDQEA